MSDGFYAFQFMGMGGGGLGALVIERGTLRGFDQGRVSYDGTVTGAPNGGLNATITMQVPPNTALPGLGMGAQPRPITIPFQVNLPPNFASGTPVPITIAGRPVQVSFTFMRAP